MKIPDIVAGAVGVGVGSYILIEGSKMPPDLIMKIGPSFFPGILAFALIGFSVFLAVSGALSKTAGDFEKIDFRSSGMKRALLSLLAAAVYAFFLKALGFLPATVLFLLALMLLLGSRKPLDLVLVPVLAALGVWIVFEKLLTISLPTGIMSVFGM